MIKPTCPHHHASLAPVVTKGVRRFECPTCRGFAVGVGALKHVLSAAEVPHFWTEVNAAPRGTISCSHCLTLMNVLVPPPGVHDPELDFCPRCQLVWLDPGEWNAIAARTHAADSSRDMHLTLAGKYADALVDMENERIRTRLPAVERATEVPVHKMAIAMVGLPTEEDADYVGRPLATYVLIALCALATLFARTNPDLVLGEFGFFGLRPLGQGVLRMFTSFFVHAGVLHLLGNAYFLWMFGDNVEDGLGRARYVTLLAGATAAGCVAFAMLDPRAGQIPLVGASGGLAGVIAYYLVRFPHRRFVVGLWFASPLSISGWVFGVAFVFRNFLGALAQVSGTAQVSHASHLAGAAVGAAAAWFIRRP